MPLSPSQRFTGKTTEITLCIGEAHLVSELVTLADAAGLYSLNEDERKRAYGQAIQMFFEDGFRIYKEQGPDAPGAVNPVEAQKMAEGLLTPEQRQLGMQMAKENGISQTQPPTGLFADYGGGGQGQQMQGQQIQGQQMQGAAIPPGGDGGGKYDRN